MEHLTISYGTLMLIALAVYLVGFLAGHAAGRTERNQTFIDPKTRYIKR